MFAQTLIAAAALLVGSAGGALAGVFPPVILSEPTSLAVYGAGVAAIYLIKKLRG
jgi:hypothetical protein